MTGINWKEFEKVFYNLESVYVNAGDEAITAMADKEPEEGKPDKHAVVILRKDWRRLGKIAEKGGWESAGARDALSFIARRIRQQQDEGSPVSKTPIDVGDNLFLVLADAENIDELRKKEEGLAERLRVICQHPQEEIDYAFDGFRAEVKWFDRVDPNIRRDGVITLEDNELYEELLQRSAERSGKNQVRFPLSLVEDAYPRTRNGEAKIYPNQYLIIYPEDSRDQPIVLNIVGDVEWNERTWRWDMGELEMRLLASPSFPQGWEELKRPILGVVPRDLEQMLYAHAIRQPHISRVFVTGGAGTGKTLIGYASALAQTLRRPKEGTKAARARHAAIMKNKYLASRFSRIFITKTNDLIGGLARQHGFRPGTIEEKLNEYIQSYVDAHEMLTDVRRSLFDLAFGEPEPAKRGALEARGESAIEVAPGLYAPMNGGIIKIQDYATWRGRTIHHAVIFMDDAQNLTPAEFKHLNQRVGLGSLVVISGDYEHQRDSDMTATSNGLFAGLRHYLGEQYVAVVHLHNPYRDAGADHAGRMRTYR
ncbi:hypothetical protein D6789_03070 [Candidatus Woesearchaeota archaeon]|nr:MAG: hypothetical protein D6789_03070 [Candidatus Woesearchaeota archaeon]